MVDEVIRTLVHFVHCVHVVHCPGRGPLCNYFEFVSFFVASSAAS